MKIADFGHAILCSAFYTTNDGGLRSSVISRRSSVETTEENDGRPMTEEKTQGAGEKSRGQGAGCMEIFDAPCAMLHAFFQYSMLFAFRFHFHFNFLIISTASSPIFEKINHMSIPFSKRVF